MMKSTKDILTKSLYKDIQFIITTDVI